MGRREFDRYQKKAINILQNAVVSAGAGSGKTTVLAERFSHLVIEQNLNVEEILTLTFTKKATVEMYGRIYQTLHEKAPEKAKNFYKANIKTLDSYCSSIAKAGCHYYGLSPDFTVDIDAVTEAINSEALPFLLKHSDNEAIRKIAGTKDLSEIAESLIAYPILNGSTIAEPADFNDMLKKQKQTVCSVWNRTVSEATKCFNRFKDAVQNFDGNTSSSTFKKYLPVLNEEFPEYAELDEDFEAEAVSDSVRVVAEFINRLAKYPKPGNLKQADEIREYLEAIRNTANKISLTANFILGLSDAKKIILLLEEFQKIANDIKRSRKIITYQDAVSLATCILRDHPEIRRQEKQKYKAIMIDEFQDNNMTQRNLLFMLAENPERMEPGIPEVKDLCPQKLFFVGDEKQSIYLFRGADVSVFRALSRDFSEGNLELSTNYRSKPELIAAFNTMFGGIPYPTNEACGQTLPSVFITEKEQQENPDSVPSYEAVYHKVLLPEQKKDEAQKEPNYKKRRMHVALYNKNLSDEGLLDPEQAEVYWIAQKIKSLMAEENYKPEDFAILFKTYSMQPKCERILLSCGLPYNTETVAGFFSDGPTNDIFSFLRLCAFPNDTLAYAKVLSSPFVNLTTKEANAILSIKALPFEDLECGLIDDDSMNRYQRAKGLYQKVKKESETSSIADMVTYLWYEAGYRYETLWNEKVNMYEPLYDRIFELARLADEDNISLAEFVDSVRTFEDETKKLEDMDIPLEQKNGIHLLTIHKSKGLEYPVVFVCGAHKTPKSESSTTPVYLSREFGTCINTPQYVSGSTSKGNFFFNMAKEENEKTNEAELKRLLYVALTRAKDQVFLTGCWSGNFKTSGKITSLLDTIQPVLETYMADEEGKASPFTFEEIPQASISVLNSGEETRTDFLQRIKEIYADAKILLPEEVKSNYISPSHLYEEDEEKSAATKETADIPMKEINALVESSGGEFGYNDFGTIAHAYMEAAITGTSPNVPAVCYNGIKNSSQKKKIIDEICKKMQSQFMQTEIGKEALESEWHKTEYSFKSRIGSTILNGQIDLVYKNSNGGYTVVDYKTNQTIEPEIYLMQLACYKDALSQMTGTAPEKIKCVLYYLRFGKSVDITKLCDSVDIKNAVQFQMEKQD